MMAVPKEEEEGYTREVINVEYEWKPPHCIECKTFGHSYNTCPKNVKKSDPINTIADMQSDGFTKVSNRKNNGKKAANNQPKTRPVSGVRPNKPKPSEYRPVTKHVNNKRGPELYGIQAEEKVEDHASASNATQWNEVLDSDEEVDEILFPE
ncbi:uncharacterized vacuolar membrane protein, partial [Tanacetum coccineum]